MKNWKEIEVGIALTLAGLLGLSVVFGPSSSSKDQTSTDQDSDLSLHSTTTGPSSSSLEDQLITCTPNENDVQMLTVCHGPELQVYSEISNLPPEFVAAQLFHESRFNPYIGQGNGFGRGQLQHGAFIETMRALLRRPDLVGPRKGLDEKVLQQQRAYQIFDDANFQDPDLQRYLAELDEAIGPSFSLANYQEQTAENISNYTALNQAHFELTRKSSTNQTPWFTNNEKIGINNQKRRVIVKQQRSLNKELDTALESLWGDFISWEVADSKSITAPSGTHLWYQIDPSNLPEDYARITDLLSAFNMRRVYASAWSQDSIQPGSELLQAGIAAYRVGENGRITNGTKSYVSAIIFDYQTLLNNLVITQN